MDKTEIEIDRIVGQPILETLCVGLDLTSMIPTFKTEAPCFIDFGVLWNYESIAISFEKRMSIAPKVLLRSIANLF